MKLKKLHIFFIIALLAIISTHETAFAHHLRGLPHYSYKENYPQVPSFEEIHRTDGYEIIFSYFDIYDTRNIDLAVYIKNLETGEAYKGKVTFRVYASGEDSNGSHPFVAEPNPTNTYKANWVYEDEGLYFLRINFEGARGEVVEEFRLAMGNIGYNKLIVFGGIGGLIALMLLVAFIRGKKEKENA